MSAVWRLLVDGPGPPDWNMAVDKALLDCALETGVAAMPTLRLYWWCPPALSLGANQRAADTVDWEALRDDGYDVVRRPTGGRAILHAEELTYSVIAPAPAGGVLGAYRWLAAGLQEGLARAGIRLELERGRRGQQSRRIDNLATTPQTSYPCFMAAGRYELVTGGRKVVGSAQCRRRGWLMQHGSILLGPEHLRLPRYLKGVDVEAETGKMARATIDCSTLLGRRIEAAALVYPFVDGFARALDIRFEESELKVGERDKAERLRLEQFGNEAWIRYGPGVHAPGAFTDG